MNVSCKVLVELKSQPILIIGKDGPETNIETKTFLVGSEAEYEPETETLSVKDNPAHFKLSIEELHKYFSFIENNKILHHKRINLKDIYDHEGMREIEEFVSNDDVSIKSINQPSDITFDFFYTRYYGDFNGN